MGKRRANTHSKNPPGRKQRILKRRIAAFREAQAGRSRRQIPRAAVPSFFTLMNLFSGFMALTQILEGRFEQACWLIVLAGFFDVLDGMMARLTDGESLFGIELDSLSDIVSFGVAPAYLVYAFGLNEFGMLGLAVSSLPAICGAVRLARFNVQFEGIKKDYFVGLPIPVQAACIVALILNVGSADWFSELSPSNLSLLMPIVVVLSGLMISNIKFDAMPKPTPDFIRSNRAKAAAYLVGLVLIIVLQQIGLLISLIAYLAHAVGRAVRNVFRAVMVEPESGNGVAGRVGETDQSRNDSPVP
ncbi:MAG: CDP-diacylglycerol--serine O-phosphatidyltransferase [Rhodothermales bacterium]|nr:CDP-diacylglycerol--serine O-phosphatidyltransferase [Rhodothermales bacterium]